MSERRWTEKQKQAIDTRDRTLLVSAAAGSGKTATLTERVIRSLTDENKPVTVDRLLVVTFTNAAASELRVKISRALSEAVEKHPEDKHLERQLFLLPEAKIRTIDSFCGDILRSNADKVGVPFNYRIADVSECELLSISVMDGLIEAVYSGLLPEVAAPAEFEELADCLTDSKRAEELSEVLRYVYEKCESEEDGIDSLRRFADIYDPEKFTNVKSSLHGSYLFEKFYEMCRHYISVMTPYIERFLSSGGEYVKYYELARSDVFAISELLTEDHALLRARISNLKLVTRPRLKEKTADTERYAQIRDSFKEDLKKMRSFFVYTEEEWCTLYASLYRLTSLLYRFLARFSELYDREKLRRGMLSYADVERYAYKCLIKDGEPTEVAENIKNSYSAVYIDEYQDVNGLQNSIFRAISRPDNCFMVGDIKQSIYGFRSARPEIFASMKKAYPPIESAKDGEPATILMSNNFRCDRGIVDFVNTVFDKAFSLLGESMGYLPEDALVYSKPCEEEPEYRRPEICLIERGVQNDEEEDEKDISPEAVASKIEALLLSGRLDDGSPIKPSDIAILLRNSRGRDHLYADALLRRGIPAKISGAKNFFLSSEVLLALCLLNSIDNPRRDIYLAGLMRSPLYSFSADELFMIRQGRKESSLYDSLVAYTEEFPDFEKGRRFIFALSGYRTLSEGIAVPELLFKLYHETGLLALAAKSGGKENLMLLYDYACSFSAGEFGGLYNFIHFINSLIDKRTAFDDVKESSDDAAVRIVTCHASKGLEYPVVFLVDAGARIRNKDTSRRIAMSEDMGIAMRLRTPSGLALVDNPVMDIINHRGTAKNFEEELRVLYVALTRARERLCIVGKALSENTDEYLEKIRYIGEDLTAYSLRKLASYLEIILALTGREPMSAEAFIGRAAPSEGEEKALLPKDEKEEEGIDISALSEELYKRFTFEYKNAPLTRLPEKLSVSKASPAVLDGSDEGIFELYGEGEVGRIAAPLFISPSSADESAKRGIATHYFMQFCDLQSFAEQGADAELSRLVKQGYISERDGARVRISELEMFKASSLFAEMLTAKSLHREMRFNVRIPAERFTEDEEKRRAYLGREILVQGVIDCIIEYENGEIGLFDYKTDRLSAAELSDRTLAERVLIDRHRTQLSYYAAAAERIFGKRPSRVGIYSLHLGDTVIIPNI